jgi:hypothetical protein
MLTKFQLFPHAQVLTHFLFHTPQTKILKKINKIHIFVEFVWVNKKKSKKIEIVKF